MVWLYNSARTTKVLEWVGKKIRFVVYHHWKLSPTYEYTYLENKFFDDIWDLLDWAIDELHCFVTDQLCDGCEK